jgi:hypothetical protein
MLIEEKNSKKNSKPILQQIRHQNKAIMLKPGTSIFKLIKICELKSFYRAPKQAHKGCQEITIWKTLKKPKK